jgi:hypothetical protein
MPLTKRIVYDPGCFCTIEQLQEPLELSISQDLQAHAFAQTLGTLRQLRVLSGYAFEIFHNLSVLVDDVNGRTKQLVKRAETVSKQLPEVEKATRKLPPQPDLSIKSFSAKYLKNRVIPLPPLFTKNTNALSIRQQYKLARSPPALWKIETMINIDCFRYFTFPGLFFQAWLKTEILRQAQLKEEHKQNKALRKERKRQKREVASMNKFQSSSGRSRSLRRAEVLRTVTTTAESVTIPQVTETRSSGWDETSIVEHGSIDEVVEDPNDEDSPKQDVSLVELLFFGQLHVLIVIVWIRRRKRKKELGQC